MERDSTLCINVPESYKVTGEISIATYSSVSIALLYLVVSTQLVFAIEDNKFNQCHLCILM